MTEPASPFTMGKDPDPDGLLERRIKHGWTLVGLFITVILVGPVLQRFGVNVFHMPHTLLEWGRQTALVVSCANVGCWMLFPMEDCAVLRKWVRPGRTVFPRHTNAFLAMMGALVLLLLLILGAVHSAFFFAAAGVGVYFWNFLGFAYIRGQVRRIAADATRLYQQQPEPIRHLSLKALAIVKQHWCSDSASFIWNWQQVRHLSLAGSFLAMEVIAPFAPAAAYFGGAAIIIVAEIWIAMRRHKRDVNLTAVEELIRGSFPQAS